MLRSLERASFAPAAPLDVVEAVWEQLNEDDRAAALETLAQLLAKAAREETTQET